MEDIMHSHLTASARHKLAENLEVVHRSINNGFENEYTFTTLIVQVEKVIVPDIRKTILTSTPPELYP